MILAFTLRQFSSVVQTYPTLCDPMECNTPVFPVYHQPLEFTQTHVYWVGDAIQHLILCHPLLLRLQTLPALGTSQMSQFFASHGQRIGVSASASVLPMNTQDWSLGCTDWISLQSKGLSKDFSTSQFKSINSSMLSFLYSLTLTSIHDYWKNHSFD